MLKVEDLGKRLEGRWIFRHVSFELGSGQVLAVVGANGSGKSTLLRVIAGLWSPSAGRVFRPSSPRLSIGYAGLDVALYPSLTGEEHLSLAAATRGCLARSEELLERVGLAAHPGKLTGDYSSGMRTRLKLALALQANPSLLLLDEPCASLDDSGRALVQEILREQASRGIALLASNDPEERTWGTHELALLG